jgi:butyryl-CoA dehydrogenase
MKDFTGKVAIVTGAASGIGRALACQLAQRGCILVLADRNTAGLTSTQAEVAEFGHACSIHELDVSDAAQFEQLAQEVLELYGQADLLFNNAGVSLVDSVSAQSLEDFHWLMNINFWGVVHGVKAFLPLLKQSPEAHIVNVSSLFGLLSLPLQSAYNASKFAVRGYTESLKMEMAGSNVSVSCVHPGGISTDITKNAKVGEKALDVPKSQLIDDFAKQAKTTPEQAASIILAGVMKQQRRILVGKDAWVLDKIVRLFPSSYEKVMGFEKKVIERYKQRQAEKA